MAFNEFVQRLLLPGSYCRQLTACRHSGSATVAFLLFNAYGFKQNRKPLAGTSSSWTLGLM